MAKQVSFSVNATSSANPRLLFGLLRSGATWPTWSPVKSFKLGRPSPGGGEGVGAVRVFCLGPLRSQEELTEISPDHTLKYSIVGGLPIRDHHAVVELTRTAQGTEITWREGFRPLIPGTGTLLCWTMRQVIQRGADGLATRAAFLSRRGCSWTSTISRESTTGPATPPETPSWSSSRPC